MSDKLLYIVCSAFCLALLQPLWELPFSEKEYWVVAGSAVVLHGFRSQTHDIDLGCSMLLADKLEQQGYIISRCEDGTRKILYSENIEIFERLKEEYRFRLRR